MRNHLLTVCGVFLLAGTVALYAHEPGEAEPTYDTPPGTVIPEEEADHYWFAPESPDNLGAGGEFHIYIDPSTHPQAGASFARFALGAGGALPTHRHDRTEEVAYFVSGEGEALVFHDGEPYYLAVTEGTVWYVPRSTWHGIRNTGGEPLVLVFATIPNDPHGLLSFFKEVSVRPGEPGKAMSPEEMAALAEEHDLILRPAEIPSEAVPE